MPDFPSYAEDIGATNDWLREEKARLLRENTYLIFISRFHIRKARIAQDLWVDIRRDNRQLKAQLHECQGDRGVLEYNRDRLFDRYEKWKNKTHEERQIIFNLQGEILALQNNPLNITGMVGYRPPIFYGRPEEDPDDWLLDMQRYIIASRINVVPDAGQASRREEAFGLVVSCLAGDALNWYLTHIRGKNWRCNNLSDNLEVLTL